MVHVEPMWNEVRPRSRRMKKLLMPGAQHVDAVLRFLQVGLGLGFACVQKCQPLSEHPDTRRKVKVLQLPFMEQRRQRAAKAKGILVQRSSCSQSQQQQTRNLSPQPRQQTHNLSPQPRQQTLNRSPQPMQQTTNRSLQLR